MADDASTATGSVHFAPLGRRTLPDEIRDSADRVHRGRPSAPGSGAAGRAHAVRGVQRRPHVGARGHPEPRVARLPRTSRQPRVRRSSSCPRWSCRVDGRKTKVRDLFETRRVIEVPMAELAACRATSDARGEASAPSRRRSRPGCRSTSSGVLDREFHSAIARASGNELLAEVYGKVLDALFSLERVLRAPVRRRRTATRSRSSSSGRYASTTPSQMRSSPEIPCVWSPHSRITSTTSDSE